MRRAILYSDCSVGLLVCLFLLSSCSPYPPADFYEVDGLVSMDAGVVVEANNWKVVHYLNSRGMISSLQEPDSSFTLNMSFYLSNPGPYSFWILTTGSGLPEEVDGLDVTIIGPDGFLTDQFLIALPSDNRLRWMNHESAEGNSKMVTLPERGEYTIQLNSRGNPGIQVHNIQMSYNDYLKPSGPGLPHSFTPEINAADLFRELPVMLPPEWMFGLIVGSAGEVEYRNTSESLSWPIKPDAYWSNVHSPAAAEAQLNQLLNNQIIPGFETVIKDNRREGVIDSDQRMLDFFEMGYHFPVTREKGNLDQVDMITSVQKASHPGHERSLFLRDIYYMYDTDFRQFPSLMTQTAKFEWTSEDEVRDSIYYPGGLQEALEAFSNPELSTYNIPFLSIPLAVDVDTSPTINEPDELLARKLQLAAFMPVMHLVYDESTSELFDLLNEQQMEILTRYSELRSKLFPYINTHAHITRQTGRGMIGGFREHSYQYRFGDAFLVAPITEPGQRQRSIFFPDEGNWYDYDTGRRYSAGQSWIVEAPLDRIPLFVKAGSVIPYRMEGGQIGMGSNDHLKVEIYTGNAGSFRLTEDDGRSRDYRRAIAARTMFRYNEVEGQLRLTIGAVQSAYESMSDIRTYELHFKHTGRPQNVTVNGESLVTDEGEDVKNRFWEYDEESATLIITLTDQWKHERTEISITP